MRGRLTSDLPIWLEGKLISSEPFFFRVMLLIKYITVSRGQDIGFKGPGHLKGYIELIRLKGSE